MKKKLLFIMMCLSSLIVQAQTAQLKGTVVDNNGDPLIGATVSVDGTTTASMTDIDGKFTLNIPVSTKTVKVTYLGYKTQVVNIQGKNDITITLEENDKVLDDVIVVGYGVQKKETLTGAISTISGKELNKRVVPSMSVALQGTMPGVTVQQTSGEPGSDGANIRIRGIGSINSTTFPLVLVDGIEMDMNQVDMSTVENISVLKDASSASIYGSRASNGVILITTKRGKEGKVKVSYSSYLTIQRPVNMPEVVSAADYLEAELNSWDNAGITVSESVREARLKLIEEQRTLKPDNWNRYDTDWKDATVSNSALLQNHNVNMVGGNTDFRYFGSLSFMDQGGLIENNNFQRVNIRINTDANIFPWLKFSNEIAYRKSKQVIPGLSTPKSIINKSLYMLPTLSAVKELDGYWGYGKNGDNPVANAEASGTNTTHRPELLLNGTFTATPIEGLELQAQYSYRKTEARLTSILTPYTTSLKGIVQGRYPGEDDVTESWTQNIRNYYRTQATYSKDISDHKFKVMGGFQAENNDYSDFSASKSGFDMDRYYLVNGDGSTASATGGASSWSMASFYGRINYDYANKYLLEFSARYDGSSRFIRENRWGFFPSASLGWIISNESFMKSVSFINHLKLRASYGTLGNQDIGNYPYASTIDPGWSYWFNKTLNSGVAQVKLSNPYIEWEKSKQWNFGLDTYLFNQKLGIEFNYYIKDVYDMLMVYPVPYYTGLNATHSNAGDMRNKGWELSVTYKEKIGDVSFSATGTLSNNENEVTKLYGLFTDRSVTEGYPYGGYWGYLTDGYYADWDDVNNSPKLTSSARPGYVKYKKLDPNTDPMKIGDTDKVYLGDPFPHYEYGLKLDATWKNFDVSVFFQGVGKRKILMSGIGIKPFSNGANLFKHQLDSWTYENPNQNAEYPILVPEANSADNFVTSDKWVKNGAYLRLKNVMIGYTLPKSIIQKIKFDSARFYVSGQNLFTLSSTFKGYDPEVSYGGSLGGEFYPIMQTFTFGIDLKF